MKSLGNKQKKTQKLQTVLVPGNLSKKLCVSGLKNLLFLSNTLDEAYRIFLNDTFKIQSVFKQAITYNLKKYHPFLDSFIDERIEKDVVSVPFSIKSQYPFIDEYEVFGREKSIVQPFYLRKEYKGREIEKLQFGQVICLSRYLPRTTSSLSLFNILSAFNQALCLALLFGFKGVAVKHITFFRISSGERKPSHSFTISSNMHYSSDD